MQNISISDSPRNFQRKLKATTDLKCWQGHRIQFLNSFLTFLHWCDEGDYRSQQNKCFQEESRSRSISSNFKHLPCKIFLFQIHPETFKETKKKQLITPFLDSGLNLNPRPAKKPCLSKTKNQTKPNLKLLKSFDKTLLSKPPTALSRREKLILNN